MNFLVVPTTNTDPGRTGQILEAICAESKYTVLPAFYESTLKGKYSCGRESKEMLDIIIANRVLCLDELFGWGMNAAIAGAIGRGDFASVIEKNLEKQEKNIEQTMEKILG